MTNELPTPQPSTRGRLRAFSRSLPMALLRSREAVMRQFRPSLHTYGITEQQWRVLRALASVETIEVLELAHATFLLPPSLSRILKDLEDRQLVLRRTSDTDQRRGVLSISPLGRSLIDAAGSRSEAIYAEITARFSSEKLKALHDLLTELEACLVEPVIVEMDTDAQVLAPNKRRRQGRPTRSDLADRADEQG